MIHEIFRPKGITNPVDFMVIIGQAAVRLGSFGLTEIGSAALKDLFTAPCFPRLTEEAIEECLETWGTRENRTACKQEGLYELYEVSPSPMGRRIRWNKKIQCEYSLDSLYQTEAGRVLLAIPISSRSDTGGEISTQIPLETHGRSTFEVQSLGRGSIDQSKHRWRRLFHSLLCFGDMEKHS